MKHPHKELCTGLAYSENFILTTSYLLRDPVSQSGFATFLHSSLYSSCVQHGNSSSPANFQGCLRVWVHTYISFLCPPTGTYVIWYSVIIQQIFFNWRFSVRGKTLKLMLEIDKLYSCDALFIGEHIAIYIKVLKKACLSQPNHLSYFQESFLRKSSRM